MAGSGTTQQSLRKALGALKDTTTVSLAKVNSDNKELDVAIVKATNHIELLAKDKHIRSVFEAVSARRPRADVAYCINALARRLAKTHNWAVAIKTLIVIHRALREVDATFREELINYTRSRSHMLNLSHFKDDSSPNAWDYSSWVRTYALYLEERLECFRVLKYDVESERSTTSEIDTVDLLEHLPALQQLLFRLLACQPEGAAVYNTIIRYALSIVASESIKIYNAINGGTLNMVDKFFEMQRHDAVRALEIYRKAGCQAERLSEFYEICKGLDLGRGQNFVKIEQPPASFISAMEEYVKEAPRTLQTNRNEVDAEIRIPFPKPILAIEHEKLNSDDGKLEPTPVPIVPPVPPEPSVSNADTSIPAQMQVADLLSLEDFSEGATKLEENNALALAIVSNDNPVDTQNTLDLTSRATGWELALVGAPSSNGSAVAESKLAGGFDKLTLDSLYDDAISRSMNPNGSYHMGQVAPISYGTAHFPQDPFSASNNIAPHANVQMADMAQQQALMTQGQQQQMMRPDNSNNPFGNPFGPTGVSAYPALNNPYAGFM
ncbi:putative clathrin assembly protein isoform X1 [Iris pallida]|uniref:Clathrin assembly protein isoform X1 n=1 Tax=Iris pallida TaxID=29817 RepID=A0AAX6EMH7_IRIPA|nr:putative clathrin assembly protein isoform X1 [Iris pallida]